MTASSRPIHPEHREQFRVSYGLILVIGLGLLFRIYSAYFVPLINPDGTLYIQQARALYYGMYGSVTDCYPYLSNYPIFVALLYPLTGDWVLSGRMVSLIFGTLSLVPLFLILRRFFDAATSTISALVFALMPAFIIHSHAVIRGPIYWFFVLLGLYFFLLCLETKKSVFLLPLSCIAFLMATWARVEGSLFLLGSALYLGISRNERGWRGLFIFLLPLLLLFASLFLYAYLFDPNLFKLIPAEPILFRLNSFISTYQYLRENLSKLITEKLPGFSPYFFPTVRSLLWLIGLGALVGTMIKAFFPPFFLILFLGVLKSRHAILKDPRLIYLSALSFGALLILYCQTLYNWAITSRHTLLFLLPAFVFVGFGISWVREFLIDRWRLKPSRVTLILLGIVFLSTLPKNLRTDRGVDNLAYKEIGQFIANTEGRIHEISVAGSFKRLMVVHFYANEAFPGAPCFDRNGLLNGNHIDPKSLIQSRFDYYIWDETFGPPGTLRQIREDFASHFQEKGEWHSPKLGKMIVFKILP
jgi:hypothetical protein